MRRTLVLNVVGLSPRLIGPHTPTIARLAAAGRATVAPVWPAVTCSVQATYLTGTWPDQHGIVGNGWYEHADCEVRFWRQSDKLVQRPRVWDLLRNESPAATTANSFWWNAMYASADVTLTPRPMYPADGRKLPDLWTHPAALRTQFQAELGQFPLFKFWGPMASIESTRWITSGAIRVEEQFRPTLHLVYLPHLDYALQKVGPADPSIAAELSAVDAEVARLVAMADAAGIAVVLLSEYGIAAVDRPVHLNRVLRDHGWLAVRDELGREALDVGASAAFAVADHQVAHVYVNDASKTAAVRAAVERTPGVAAVYGGHERAAIHLNHPRAGDLVVLADQGAWFTYYYWQDDARAPDFARTVDIHRKPGYDPAELFLDPALRWPKLRIGAKLAARRLGQRNLLDVIPLDATLVRGSHGAPPADPQDGAVLLSSVPGLLDRSEYAPTGVAGVILNHLRSG